MALWLSDRAVKCVRTILAAGMTDRLAELDLEFANSTATPVPAFYDTRFGNNLPDNALGEVYEQGSIDFPLAESESMQWSVSPARMSSRIPVTVRITHHNRRMGDQEDMVQRSRIYELAVARVLRGNRRPSGDECVHGILLRSVEVLPADELAGDDKRTRVDRVYAVCEVALQEGNTSEGTAGLVAASPWS